VSRGRFGADGVHPVQTRALPGLPMAAPGEHGVGIHDHYLCAAPPAQCALRVAVAGAATVLVGREPIGGLGIRPRRYCAAVARAHAAHRLEPSLARQLRPQAPKGASAPCSAGGQAQAGQALLPHEVVLLLHQRVRADDAGLAPRGLPRRVYRQTRPAGTVAGSIGGSVQVSLRCARLRGVCPSHVLATLSARVGTRDILGGAGCRCELECCGPGSGLLASPQRATAGSRHLQVVLQ
jgi:hypothetical protein